MSLEQKAKNILQETSQINNVISEIQHDCSLMLEKQLVGNEIIEFSAEQKQKILEHYQTKKAELKALVDEMP